MTRIFFYHNATDRVAAAAALIGKAFRQKKEMLVFAPDRILAADLDRQLWVHPATGFVPHVYDDSPLAAETPVLITATPETSPHNERLFNLSAEIPPGFSRFTSVIEVVGQNEDDRLSGRERVRFYKDRGYEITFFDLAEKH